MNFDEDKLSKVGKKTNPVLIILIFNLRNFSGNRKTFLKRKLNINGIEKGSKVRIIDLPKTSFIKFNILRDLIAVAKEQSN